MNDMKQMLFWVLPMTLSFLACSRELEPVENAAETSSAEWKVWTVQAAIENAQADAAKANVDESTLQVLWQAGDVIGLVDAAGVITPATLTSGEGTALGSFSYQSEQEITASYAFYPYQEETASVSGTTLSIKLPTSQNLSTTGGMVAQNTLIMVAKPEGGSMLFKNCCAIAKISVSGTENYARKAYLACADSRLCGVGTVDLLSDSPVFTLPAVDETTESSDIRERYTILNINAVNTHRLHVTPSGPSEPLYFVVPAGTFTNLSLETLGNTSGDSGNSGDPVESSYTTVKEVTFNAGKIRPLAITLAPATGTDLTAGDAYANCFMLTSSSTEQLCSFAAYKRNIDPGAEEPYNTTFSNGYYAHVLWQSTEGLLDGVTYDYVGKRVSFVRKASKTGNAVIALRDRTGVTRWSWHIWVTPDAIQTRTFGGVVFMDRNLGAMSAVVTSDANAPAALGTYYQWGRKDPFPGPADFSAAEAVCAPVYPASVRVLREQNGKSVSWATQRPSVFIWGSANGAGAEDWCSTQNNNLWGTGGASRPKTQADPCPYGWRLPTKANFEGTGGLHVTLKAATLEHYCYTVVDADGKSTSFSCGGRWRRKDPGSPLTHLAQVGTYCYLWTLTCSPTNDVLNTDYYGSCTYRRYGTSSGLVRSEPHRWGAQIRCVQFDEDSYEK